MLTNGLDVARSGLSSGGDQASIVSRNIANAGNALYSKKRVQLVTAPNGGVTVAGVTRASNDALTRSVVNATADSSAKQAIADALSRLDATVNDPELDISPAAMLGKLQQALQVYASSPTDNTVGRAAVQAAKDLALSLNDAASTISSVRQDADASMGASVARINSLLEQFGKVNSLVISGTRLGTDVTDYLDQRDELVRSISEELGVRTMIRGDNDMVLFTDSGLTLFDTNPRTVTMQQSPLLPAGGEGNAVYVDGVPVTGSGAILPISSGKLSGLAVVRDQLTITYQQQIDEVARGLIEAFAESDQGVPSAHPNVPGLFTYPGAPAMLPTGLVANGLAGTIRVNATVDPDAGGDFRLLRDGAISDPGNSAYVYNSDGSAGFTGRLEQLIDGLTDTRSFDSSTGLLSSSGLISFASSTSGWLQAERQSYSEQAEYRATLLERAREALSRETGVNLDEEMATLLEIERAYQTSSKLIATIDEMLQALLNAT